MKEQSSQKAVLVTVERIVRRRAQLIEKQWPPTCMGILHQPKRPPKMK